MTTARRYKLVCLCLLAAGCGGGDAELDGGSFADAGGTPDAAGDPTELMFEPDRVLHIEIELSDADWDQLRTQSRSIFDVLGASCLQAPPERPYTYFPSTVTIDGETVELVGVRKKGFFGSLSDTKPSLKLKFSEYVSHQRFSGIDRMTLNNNKSDPSHIKQCIGYALFRQAGVPAPRCNFATVTVNGVALGVFSHVESIREEFLGRHFGDSSGNLYEGALSDFRIGWVETFQRKTNRADYALGQVDDRSDIERLVPALQTSNSGLLDALDPLINVNEFLSLWAMEVIVMHADGYARNTNNFYLYNDPATGQFHFIPWGIDAILFDNVVLPWEDEMPPESVWVEGVLSRRLYNHPDSQQLYFDRMEELLATVWDEEALAAEIDRMEALLSPHLLPGEEDVVANAIDDVRNFVAARRTQLRAELDAEPPGFGPTLRAPWCLGALGTVSASFAGNWSDDLPATNPFEDGSCSLTSDIAGLDIADLPGGTTVGIDPDSGEPILRLAAWVSIASDPNTESSVALVVLVRLSPEQLTAQTLELQWPDNEALVARLILPPAGAPPVFELVGLVGEATLELTAAGATQGAAVSGSLTANVYEPPF